MSKTALDRIEEMANADHAMLQCLVICDNSGSYT